jgi:uncharacterized protein
MNETNLTPEEKQILLRLARQTIELAANHRPPLTLRLEDYPPALRTDGAAFVTLTTFGGELRGCIGALAPYQPLVQDVCEHAAAAALEDPRFPPVRPAEVPRLQIEISRLTTPEPFTYNTPQELLERLQPGVDGVVLRDGFRRATFLPQVWEHLPDKADFLSHLCSKMGAPANLWQRKVLQVELYQVEEFSELNEEPG